MANKDDFTKDPEDEDCPTCGGAEDIECPTCKGTGATVNSRGKEVSCKECKGDGWITCPECWK